jgi:prepilin-type N-terminal cleavage/methylation domain-containing protein
LFIKNRGQLTMSFTNIKLNSQERGFTIVELLIVVVVIAILAAITIVSYNGITSRANTSSAATNVETIQKIAEAYNSDCSGYPVNLAQFRNGCTTSNGQTITAAATLPNSVTLISAPGTTNPTTSAAGSMAATVTASGLATTVSTSGSSTTMQASNGTTVVAVYVTKASASATTATGGVVITWDYGAGRIMGSDATASPTSKLTFFGTATSSSTFYSIAAS